MPTTTSEMRERMTTYQEARQARRGFTLIELMAATGIMVAIILLVLSLTTNVLNSWNASSAQLAQNYEARVAMDLLAKDLQTMRMRSNGMAWLQVEQENVGGPAGSQPFTRLYFFSPALDRPTRDNNGDDIPGDICAISYRVAYRNPFEDAPAVGERPQYGLYRSVVDAKNTFDTALDLGTYDSSPTGPTSLKGLWTGGSLSAVGQDNLETVNETWTVDAENYLSANVVEFEIDFYYEAVDGSINLMGSNEFVFTSKPIPEPTPAFKRMSYAEVRMTVLGDEGAQIVANNVIPSTLTWDQFKGIYGQTFTRRIYIFGNPI